MLRTLWSRLIDAVLGTAGRSVRLDADDRRNIPGWPRGLDLGSAPATCALASVADRRQQALPLYWDRQTSTAAASGFPKQRPFAVIDGGHDRNGVDART